LHGSSSSPRGRRTRPRLERRWAGGFQPAVLRRRRLRGAADHPRLAVDAFATLLAFAALGVVRPELLVRPHRGRRPMAHLHHRHVGRHRRHHLGRRPSRTRRRLSGVRPGGRHHGGLLNEPAAVRHLPDRPARHLRHGHSRAQTLVLDSSSEPSPPSSPRCALARSEPTREGAHHLIATVAVAILPIACLVSLASGHPATCSTGACSPTPSRSTTSSKVLDTIELAIPRANCWVSGRGTMQTTVSASPITHIGR
jgi:hypothetical protein